jgi:flavin reductase (DIM6/NTAB) family NADH-FMN oxidoreductase RutF
MKKECRLEDVFGLVNQKLKTGGLLLTSCDQNGRRNVMTIGWGLIGVLWREPAFMVAIRPSRYTHRLIEDTGEFTVNVPGEGMEEVLAYCGKVSGRDHNKFSELRLSVEQGKKVRSPSISGCIAHIECKVVGKAHVAPELLSKDILDACYPSGDYHTLYFGRPVSILKEE